MSTQSNAPATLDSTSKVAPTGMTEPCAETEFATDSLTGPTNPPVLEDELYSVWPYPLGHVEYPRCAD
jgi:hypothetical protein